MPILPLESIDRTLSSANLFIYILYKKAGYFVKSTLKIAAKKQSGY